MLEKLRRHFKKIVIILAVLAAAFLILGQLTVTVEKRVCFAGYQAAPDEEKACLGVEVADSAEEARKGLSGKPEMDEDEGMWFVFSGKAGSGSAGNKPQRLAFWMKGMNFGLDFIWLRDGVVVDITEKVVRPKNEAEEQNIYQPKVPVDGVIEVNAGWVERHGIEVGDMLVVK